MTEVEQFLSMLCDISLRGNQPFFRRCRTDEERRIVVTDLLRHAYEDEMSREDLEICREALNVLEEKR